MDLRRFLSHGFDSEIEGAAYGADRGRSGTRLWLVDEIPDAHAKGKHHTGHEGHHSTLQNKQTSGVKKKRDSFN